MGQTGPADRVLNNAAKLVLSGNYKSNGAANAHDICHVTLTRYIRKKKENPDVLASVGNRAPNKVLTVEMEWELAEYARTCADMFSGLAPKDVKQLAYQCVLINNCRIPETWVDRQTAGS